MVKAQREFRHMSAHVPDCACSQLVDVHLANECTCPPFKSVKTAPHCFPQTHFTIAATCISRSTTNTLRLYNSCITNQHHELLPH